MAIVQIIFMNVAINVRRKMAIIYEVVKWMSQYLNPKRNIGKKRFQYNGGLIWNPIPKEIRLTSTINILKIKLKAYRLSLLNKCNI